MSMKAIADLLVTVLGGITSPVTPDKVQKVPSQHGDDRPRIAVNKGWINLEPFSQDRTDEANRATLRQYGYIAHFWYSSTKHDLEDTADIQMDMADALITKLLHNNLSGNLRIGIANDDMDTLIFEGGEDDDTTYVVRLPFTVWEQVEV